MLAGMLAAAVTPTEETCFQSFAPYDHSIDIRSSVAIVYGVDDTMPGRIAGWKDRGYNIHVMTGSAWGRYGDYFSGKFDGRPHQDEGQAGPDANIIWHDPGTVPYVVPTDSYVDYLISLCKQAVDAGATGLHLEEPEFWSRAGYSEGFKRLWAAEYGTAWKRPDSSPDAFWRAAKLKYLLYKRALARVFDASKQHARNRNQPLRCFVPTHSLINYAQWGIVSPESSLMDLPNCDGYIAQVWTGTARSPNVYRGVTRERTFEAAYLEYSSAYHMVAPTGRTVYFLADPVEDDPNHTWDDYRFNYERVLVASLLFPQVHHFEVMPWPDRVMTMKYPAGAYSPNPAEKIVIPPDYWRELLVCVNALNEMDQPQYRWKGKASSVGLLVSDTMMFQRGSPWAGPGTYDEFFGVAMPLVKHGIDTRCVVLERIRGGEALNDIGVLLMSYEHMKPLDPDYHREIADWVRAGGVLVYFGSDKDPFHRVEEWWKDSTPRDDLFSRMKASTTSTAVQRTGKGAVIFCPDAPAAFASDRDGASSVIALVAQAFEATGDQLHTRNSFVLERGPFVVGSVMDETSQDAPLRLKGLFADMFTSDAAIRRNPEFGAGQAFLLRRIPGSGDTQVLATTACVDATTVTGETTWMNVRGPVGAGDGFIRVWLPGIPTVITVDCKTCEFQWDGDSKTALIPFRHNSAGNRIQIRHAPSLPPAD